jgi:hypothetical protein
MKSKIDTEEIMHTEFEGARTPLDQPKSLTKESGILCTINKLLYFFDNYSDIYYMPLTKQTLISSFN